MAPLKHLATKAQQSFSETQPGDRAGAYIDRIALVITSQPGRGCSAAERGLQSPEEFKYFDAKKGIVCMRTMKATTHGPG